jgi:hypothetical protein
MRRFILSGANDLVRGEVGSDGPNKDIIQIDVAILLALEGSREDVANNGGSGNVPMRECTIRHPTFG